MFALDRLTLTPEQRKRLAYICIHQPFTGSGQTVPSYRIPILWENYLCSIRNVLAKPPLVGDEPMKTKSRKKNKGDVKATPCS